MFTPFNQQFSFAVNFNRMVSTSISLLLPNSRPPAIFWRVALIVVYTVNRCIRERTREHIRREVFVGKPPLANRNASAAIIFEAVLIFISTSLNHAFPATVRSCLRRSMRAFRISNFLQPRTSATRSCAAYQAGARERFTYSAIAQALPPRMSVGSKSVAGLNQKHSKSTAYQIFQWVRFVHGIPLNIKLIPLILSPLKKECKGLIKRFPSAVISLTDEGDTAIRERNALIDRYNIAADECRKSGSAQ